MQLTTPRTPQDDDFEALRTGLNGFNEALRTGLNGFNEALRTGLNGFNEAVTGQLLRERIASFIKSEDDVVLGGILGEIKWGWLHIEGLWVDGSIRQGGWGTRLLGAMEQYALSQGITNFHLETTSFQALPFYQKQGYSVFGELPDMPPGHVSYFLKKQDGQ